jgi:hypothetical protein
MGLASSSACTEKEVMLEGPEPAPEPELLSATGTKGWAQPCQEEEEPGGLMPTCLPASKRAMTSRGRHLAVRSSSTLTRALQGKEREGEKI